LIAKAQSLVKNGVHRLYAMRRKADKSTALQSVQSSLNIGATSKWGIAFDLKNNLILSGKVFILAGIRRKK